VGLNPLNNENAFFKMMKKKGTAPPNLPKGEEFISLREITRRQKAPHSLPKREGLIPLWGIIGGQQ
jgi:hypothetical protein